VKKKMEKPCCEIKCYETKEGFTVEVNGKSAREMFESCKKGNFSCCNTN